MPALSYKGRFVEYVEAGLQPTPKKGQRIKKQTIRNFRKYPIKAGDTLYHFYGMRTKWCKKIGESICTEVFNVKLTSKSVRLDGDGVYNFLRDKEDLNRFAFDDGFTTWEEMIRWWKLTHGTKCFPFTGQLIKW